MEHIRNNIWDYIFKNGPQSIDHIAEQFHLTRDSVTHAVAHDWFTEERDRIAIATQQGTLDHEQEPHA